MAEDNKEELNSGLWPTMSLAALYKQELLLQRKLDIIRNLGNVPVEQQLVRLMTTLQEHIRAKSKDDPDKGITVIMR